MILLLLNLWLLNVYFLTMKLVTHWSHWLTLKLLTHYSFINEVIAQIVYNQLQIELLALIKAKSIQEFDDHYAKKLIIHVIYLNLTVQDHMIDTASMLITWLNQHQMILEKTWMNKINLVIDMQINFLRFSIFTSSQKSIVLLTSNKTITKQKSLCYDSSYASMLIAMLMTMLIAMFLAIVDRSSLGYRVVSKPTLFRVSLCSSESYR